MPQLKIMHGKPRHGQSQGIKRDHKESLNAEKYYQKLGWKLEICSVREKPHLLLRYQNQSIFLNTKKSPL